MQSANHIQEMIGEINRVMLGEDKLIGELNLADQGGVVEQTRAFVALRQIKDMFDASIKQLNLIYEDYKVNRLPTAFEAAGVPTVNLDEGYRVTVQHKLHASIRGDKKEEAYKWLNENGLGDLITNTVNASTLSAAAKSMAEDNIELPDEIFNVAIIPNTSVTKTKK